MRPARSELRELQRMVRILERHVTVARDDRVRDLDLLGPGADPLAAESHLQALTALLVSLSTYQELAARSRRARRPAARPPAARPAAQQRVTGGRGAAANGVAKVNGHGATVDGHGATVNGHGAAANGVAKVNGHGGAVAKVNGTHVDATAAASNGHGAASGPDAELAAATARYIARDLAARSLSEFTSAEAYRLARSLARLGGVSEPVERLLAEANQVRLHPTPLADAVSHSPR